VEPSVGKLLTEADSTVDVVHSDDDTPVAADSTSIQQQLMDVDSDSKASHGWTPKSLLERPAVQCDHVTRSSEVSQTGELLDDLLYFVEVLSCYVL